MSFVRLLKNIHKTNDLKRVDDHNRSWDLYVFFFCWKKNWFFFSFFSCRHFNEKLTRKSSSNRHILNHMVVFKLLLLCSVVDDYPIIIIECSHLWNIFTIYNVWRRNWVIGLIDWTLIAICWSFNPPITNSWTVATVHIIIWFFRFSFHFVVIGFRYRKRSVVINSRCDAEWMKEIIEAKWMKVKNLSMDFRDLNRKWDNNL